MLCNYLDVFERAWATRDSTELLLPARSCLESVKLKFFEANIEKKKLVELDQLYWKTSFEKCNLVCLSLQPSPCILSFRGHRGSCPSSLRFPIFAKQYFIETTSDHNLGSKLGNEIYISALFQKEVIIYDNLSNETTVIHAFENSEIQRQEGFILGQGLLTYWDLHEISCSF